MKNFKFVAASLIATVAMLAASIVPLAANADSSPTVQPSMRPQCKNDGWQDFNNPAFADQANCFNWVQTYIKGHFQLDSPRQHITFYATNQAINGNSDQHGRVTYWNFNYPENNGVLHYEAPVTCSYVNPNTSEARFMFQIPEGHPGLTGVYVVVYVNSNNSTYGHTSTGDEATATQWCQTGEGFSPTMYPVISGEATITSNNP